MSYIPVGWPLASLARSAAIAAALSVGLTAEAQATDQTPAPANQAMTPAPAKGEFNNFCTEGLASGQLAKTDCSVNWTNSDSRMYCFSSEDSKAAFLKDPAGNLQQAREFFASKQASAGKATKEFTEDDVNKRVQEVIAERSMDGAFVFHDPKLDASLNLLFEQIKTVRGMEGYGWFANVIFHEG